MSSKNDIYLPQTTVFKNDVLLSSHTFQAFLKHLQPKTNQNQHENQQNHQPQPLETGDHFAAIGNLIPRRWSWLPRCRETSSEAGLEAGGIYDEPGNHWKHRGFGSCLDGKNIGSIGGYNYRVKDDFGRFWMIEAGPFCWIHDLRCQMIQHIR